MPKKKEKKPKKSEEEIAAEEAARAAELSQKRKELEELTIENEALKAISRELGVSLEKHIQVLIALCIEIRQVYMSSMCLPLLVIIMSVSCVVPIHRHRSSMRQTMVFSIIVFLLTGPLCTF